MTPLKKYLTLTFLSLFILGGLFFYQQAKFNDHQLHLVFCNVGQGDGIYIRTSQGLDILIDGGPNDSILNCLNNHMPFWDRDIELMILTHPHADHAIGLISVLKRYTVLSFATSTSTSSTDAYKELVNLLKTKNIKQKSLKSGDKFASDDGFSLTTEWSGSGLEVLGSKAEYFNQNESSVIELLSFGHFSALLTGDSDAYSEMEIENKLPKIDILKVSHHGSKTGTSKEFLEMIKPKLAVISVGKNNNYNLPYPKTIETLKSLGIKILRTDENGEVEIVSDGEKWTIN